MAPDVTISRQVLDDLFARAAASPDAEICGLLFGEAGRITAAQPAANVAADPTRRFEIDPAALIAAHRAGRGGGARLIGHYHSHPTGDPASSPRDAAESAGDGMLWLVIAGGEATVSRSTAPGVLTRLVLAVA